MQEAFPPFFITLTLFDECVLSLQHPLEPNYSESF